ncbi:TonB-dependent receptor [soil metagenome]
MHFFSPSQTGITLLLLTLSSAALGQVTTVTGQVKDEGNRPVSFANVLLLQAQDSALYKGTLSEKNGNFSLENVSPGTYLVKAFMIGYKPQFTAAFTVSAGQSLHRLPSLTLALAAKLLNEVTVEAQKPLFEQHLDRLVVNVQSSITSAGATALEVLERSPGVTVNRQNNSLAMSGKQWVIIMINGKPSRIPMEAVMQMLSSMSAANIEKIELITTPSAQYDAEGNAGVINLVIKKNENLGTNGSYALTMGYGRYERPAASFNVNHRNQKLNLFSDYSFGRNHVWQSMSNQRLVSHQLTSTRIENFTSRDPTITNHTGRLGFEYSLWSKTSLSGLFSGFSNKLDIDERSNTQIYRAGQLSSSIAGKHLEINHWRHVMGNLNLQHTLPNRQEINFDLDYLYYHNDNPHQYAYTFSPKQENNPSGNIRIEKQTPIQLWVAKGDYKKGMGEHTKLEAGLKATISRLGNNVLVEDYLEGKWLRNPDFSMNMDMLEDIGAGYLNLNHTFSSKVSLQAGLRGEYTRTDLGTPEDTTLIQRRYFNLFPSVFVAKDLTKESSLQVSYGRRITRPTYNNLAPFVYFIDPNTFFSGNINLLPAITDAFQSTYRFKNKYLLSLGYSYDKNPIIPWQVYVDPETNVQVAHADNLRNSNSYSLTFTLPVRLTSWWDINSNLMGVWQVNRTTIEGKDINLQAGFGSLNMTQSFKLPQNFSAELTGFYRSRSPFGISYMRAMGAVNVGIQKKLKDEKGIFRFGVDDLFWTTRWRFVTDQPALNINQNFVGAFSEPRIFKITYSRNFGNKNVSGAKKRTTGSDEERKRVGN